MSGAILLRLRGVNTTFLLEYAAMYCGAYSPNRALKMAAAIFSECCVHATETRGDTYQKAVILRAFL